MTKREVKIKLISSMTVCAVMMGVGIILGWPVLIGLGFLLVAWLLFAGVFTLRELDRG